MRILGMSVLGLIFMAGPALAQQGQGACMLETIENDPVNIGACTALPAKCDSDACLLRFEWSEGFSTDLQSGTALFIDTFLMNGQSAGAPQALATTDPRLCVFNESTEGLFCFIQGIEAFTLAAGGAAAQPKLMAIAKANPTKAFGNMPVIGEPMDSSASSSGGKKKSGGDESPAMASELHKPFQGRYVPNDNFSCTDPGGDGNVFAMVGNVLEVGEMECTLSAGSPVGDHGAVLFDANCNAEGTDFPEQFILHNDAFGAMAVLSSEGVAMWDRCQ